MASTSEVGHAKNIANLNTLNTHILALGNTYNPSNPNLAIHNLQALYTTALAQQQDVNNLVAPYALAVDEREQLFKPLSKEITKLRKAYKATQGVTPAQVEDFMSIARKIKGENRTTTKSSQATTPQPEQTSHSNSQMSYDQRTNNFQQLIALLQNTPNYNPNETEYQVPTYQAKHALMLQKTQAVANTYVPLNNARSQRNNTLYQTENNLVDTANKAKDYIATILDTSSTQYKAIARLKFKKN